MSDSNIACFVNIKYLIDIIIYFVNFLKIIIYMCVFILYSSIKTIIIDKLFLHHWQDSDPHRIKKSRYIKNNTSVNISISIIQKKNYHSLKFFVKINFIYI